MAEAAMAQPAMATPAIAKSAMTKPKRQIVSSIEDGPTD